MNITILVPYWGNDPRYRNLLEEWFAAYNASGCKLPVRVITDKHTNQFGAPCVWYAYDTPEYDPAYQFDHKGDIVCAAIQQFIEPVLVLDSDAILKKDVTGVLESLQLVPFAMPADEGALGLYIRNRHGQPTKISKRCAGVLWFGGVGSRVALVQDYRAAFAELKTGRYYEERRLFEQHAWSMVAHNRNALVLPRTMNWLDNNTRNGPNSDAYIYHRIGQRKFNVAFKPRAA
jgi:hypothetical protein